MSTIELRHANHGYFAVDAKVLSRAIFAHGSSSLHYVRTQAAGCAGYPEPGAAWLGVTALDDCTLVEALIIWVDSGNHLWHDANVEDQAAQIREF